MEYKKRLEASINNLELQLRDLLGYSQNTIELLVMSSYIKQKTVYRINIFSALYQRIEGIIVLSNAKQTNDINIILRSVWELLAEHNFVGMHRGNLYLEILAALEMLGTKKQWSAIKALREKYPNANTWQKQWSDELIEGRINWAVIRLTKFKIKHPTVNLSKYDRLLKRLEAVDAYNVAKYTNHKNLSQMDYRTVYSLFSDDVHSTLAGTIENSRFTQTGLQVRLDKYDLDTLRALTTAYSMLLDYINFIARHYRLNQAIEIKALRVVEKKQLQLYKELETLA